MPFLFPNFLRKYANIITLSGLMLPPGPLRKKYSFKWDYSNSFPYQQLHWRLAAHVAMDVSKMTEVFGQRNKEALDTRGKKHTLECIWELLLYLISQGVSFHVFAQLQQWSLLPVRMKGAFQTASLQVYVVQQLQIPKYRKLAMI